jgi:hypothetical protein
MSSLPELRIQEAHEGAKFAGALPVQGLNRPLSLAAIRNLLSARRCLFLSPLAHGMPVV